MSDGPRGPNNKLWVIETEDCHGLEGCICVLAKTKEDALRKIEKRILGETVISAETVLWVEFATVTGERGETYYLRRGHEKENEKTPTTPQAPQASKAN